MSTKTCESIPTPIVQSPVAPATVAEVSGPRGRPSWSGLLRLSMVVVPVKAYPALNSSGVIHFNQLHVNCGQRIQYQKRCPVHGPVEAAEIVRGYQYAPDQYVTVEAEELEKLRPIKDKALILEKYVTPDQVDPVLFAGRSLYLLPDGLAARHTYGLVAEALREAGVWSLGRVVLSGHRHLVLVRSLGRLLVMDELNYPAAVRAASAWEAGLRACAATTEEINLTRTLIDANGGPLDWSQFRDTTAEEMTALIEAKLAGQPVAAAPEEPLAVLHLLDALKQSVAALGQKPKTSKGKSTKPRTSRRATA